MKLFKHQEDILKLNPRYHLLAWECGTGKTLTSIKLAEQNTQRILVVCPKSLKENWAREIKKWGRHLDVNASGPDVIVSNHPAAWKVVTKEEFRKDWELYASELYDGLIIDEAHFFGGYKSKMFKNAVKYLKKVKPECVYLLTATPYMSTPYNIMCLEILLGRQTNYMKYRFKYFWSKPMGGRNIPVIIPEAKYELATIVNEIGTTIKKEDCLDLPSQVYLQEDFNLTPEQKRVTRDLEENPLVAAAIVYWTKRHQINGGTMRLPESDDTVRCKSEKLTRVLQLAEEHKKLIIVCRYNEEIKLISEQLKKPYVVLNGNTPGDQRQALLDQANAADEMVFLVNSACSEGYNLTRFNTMVFYSNGFSFKDRVQMEGRIHRIGQENKCTYIDLVVKDTVDEAVLTSLKNKEDFNIEIYANKKTQETLS